MDDPREPRVRAAEETILDLHTEVERLREELAAERVYAKAANVLVGDAIKAFCDNPNDMLKQLEAVFDITVERAIAGERERCAKEVNLLLGDHVAEDRLQQALAAIRRDPC